MNHHLADHRHHHELQTDSTLHVVGVLSNPVRWHTRYRLARQWLSEMEKHPNVRAYMVEAAFGDRHHEVTMMDDHCHLQLRTNTEIWIKENMINLGVRYLLPRDWKYMAWVDADITFRNPNWALETIHQLQHWPVVQPWQQCSDLGPHGNVMQLHQSFGWMHQQEKPKKKHPDDYYGFAHPGYAWACTRKFWEQANGLMDFCILGSADRHMAWAMIGDSEWSVNSELRPGYHRRVKEWQDRAVRITHKQVGFTHGRIEHNFHGSKSDRNYQSRWQILIDHKYDPDTDLMYDEQGLIYLAGKPDFEQAIRQYNRARNEDSGDE